MTPRQAGLAERKMNNMNATANTLTKAQIVWASQHDWFNKDNGNGTVTVKEEFFEGMQLVEVGFRIFGNFQALRDWAGY